MQQEITDIEIDWTESSNRTSSVGSPYLFGWLRASYVRPGLIEDGRVIVLVRDDTSMAWSQFEGPVSLTEADGLVVAFSLLGAPTRAPRIETIYDASETWFTCSVRVAIAGQAQTFTIQSQRSGFRGPDADDLRAVFQRIMALSGYARQRTLFGDITERKP